MSNRTILTLTVAAAAILATPAFAKNGVYVSGALGAAVTSQDDSFRVVGTPGRVNGDLETETGFHLNGAVGYDLHPVRVEAAVGYIKNDLDKLEVPSQTIDLSGHIENMTYMANVYYDFDTNTALKPYLGVGLGAAHYDIEDGSDDTAFAYQGIVGASYAVNDCLSLTGDYRYLATAETTVKLDNVTSVDVKEKSHTFNVGLRYAF